MILLNEKQIDRIVSHRRLFIVGGVALICFAAALPVGWKCGFLTGFMLYSLGIYSVFFRNWRSEPGVWMLATFLTVLLTPCWAHFEWLQWKNVFAPMLANKAPIVQNGNAMRLSIDAGFSLILFAKTVRLSISVAIENWKRTRRHRRQMPAG